MAKLLLRRFFRWLVRVHGVGQGLFDSIRLNYPRISQWTGEVLTREEALRIISLARCFRDRAVLYTLWDTAGRPGEVLRLRVGDVRVDEKGCVVRLCWKGEENFVRLTEAAPELLLWLQQHPDRENPEAPLWPVRGGRAPTKSWLRVLVWNLGRRAGISKPCFPYLFRHSRLTELAGYLTDSELKARAGWVQDSEMADTYVHLSGARVGDRLLANRGLELPKSYGGGLRACAACRRQNSPIAPACLGCGRPSHG